MFLSDCVIPDPKQLDVGFTITNFHIKLGFFIAQKRRAFYGSPIL